MDSRRHSSKLTIWKDQGKDDMVKTALGLRGRNSVLEF